MKKAVQSHAFTFPKDFAPGYFQLRHLDTNTGLQTPWEPFDAKWSKFITSRPIIVTIPWTNPPSHTEYYLPSCALSPDSQWLVWLHDNTTWFAARLDGSRQLQWPAAGRYKGVCAWLPDSHRWVELVQTYRQGAYHSEAIVHSIVAPSVSHKVPINADAGADGTLEGVTDKNALLVVSYGYGLQWQTPQIRITKFPLAGPSAKPEVITSHPPQIGEVFGVALSPMRDQLAWVTMRNDQERYSLWLSYADGHKWQQVGSGPLETFKQGTGVGLYLPQAVQWTPDGTRVSFIYRDTLYTVPVKRPL